MLAPVVHRGPLHRLRAPGVRGARALSTTSLSTVARSRLALMRRIAALSREMRSPDAPLPGPAGSGSFNAPLTAAGVRRSSLEGSE